MYQTKRPRTPALLPHIYSGPFFLAYASRISHDGAQITRLSI